MPLESTTGIATRDGLECDSISREPRFTWTKKTSSAGGLLRCQPERTDDIVIEGGSAHPRLARVVARLRPVFGAERRANRARSLVLFACFLALLPGCRHHSSTARRSRAASAAAAASTAGIFIKHH